MNGPGWPAQEAELVLLKEEKRLLLEKKKSQDKADGLPSNSHIQAKYNDLPHGPRTLPIVWGRICLLFLFSPAKFSNTMDNMLSMVVFSWILATPIFHFSSYFLCHVIWALYSVLIHAIIIILLDCIIFKGVSFSIHLLEADYPGDNPHITDGATLIPLTEQWGECLNHRLQSLVKPWAH